MSNEEGSLILASCILWIFFLYLYGLVWDSIGTPGLSRLCDSAQKIGWFLFLFSQLDLSQIILLNVPKKYYLSFDETRIVLILSSSRIKETFLGCHKEKVNANWEGGKKCDKKEETYWKRILIRVFTIDFRKVFALQIKLDFACNIFTSQGTMIIAPPKGTHHLHHQQHCHPRTWSNLEMVYCVRMCVPRCAIVAVKCASCSCVGAWEPIIFAAYINFHIIEHHGV